MPNYEGHYQVSDLGRVKSFKRGKEKILKYLSSGRDYIFVHLCKNGDIKTFSVHVLVAIAFHGHTPDGTQRIVVDHIDNDKLNNRADNINLVSNRENTSKDRKGGTSDYVGVCLDKNFNKWRSYIEYNKRKLNLGFFDTEIEAHNAYQKALKEIEQGLDLNIIYPLRKGMSSKFVGVYWHNVRKKWAATYKGKHIGKFLTEIEAYEARENYIKTTIKNNETTY